ncbi:unnamed protein product [Clonostachys rosea]|uniref:Aflatoxin regulatory protein domain-containing protein n=1 Tax=Bionectria ochroleuca TaxID=29856 RepID=A0ABY6UYT0_BIOOC|nr:unnamed protein product [Clonostachys rosea]
MSEQSDTSELSSHGADVYAQQWSFEDPLLDGPENHEFAQFIGDLCELPQDYGVLEQPHMLEATSSIVTERPHSCDCIVHLSRTIDTMRRLDPDPEFLSSLRLLREAVQTLSAAISCKVCPLHFMSAMQNGLLLCTAVISTAHGYVRVAKVIDAEESRASRANERKTFDVGDFSGQALDTFTLEVSPREWRKLALRLLGVGVFGVANSAKLSFSSVILKLEERQKSWHASPPGPDFPDAYCVTDGKPACLRLVDDSKKIISCLSSHSDEFAPFLTHS